MPSIHAEYNTEIIQAHREALKALRELLAEETDPTERRRLAVAILRVRPVKDPEAQPSSTALTRRAESDRAAAASNAAKSLTGVTAQAEHDCTPSEIADPSGPTLPPRPSHLREKRRQPSHDAASEAAA